MIQPSLSEIEYGTYTPTITNGANVASSANIGQCGWYKIGNMVTVQGYVTITATANATFTELKLSFPKPSNIGSAEHCTGTFGHHSATTNVSGSIYGDFTNDLATFSYVSTTTNATNMRFHFTYRII